MKKQLLSIIAALTVSAVFAQVPSPSWATSQNAAFTNTSVGIRYMDAVDQNVMWVTGYDGFAPIRNYNWFSRTTNGGTSYTSGVIFSGTNAAIGDTNNYVLANLDAINANTAWVCAYQRSAPHSIANPGGGVIYRTTNGGANWTNMTATGMFTNVASSFADFVIFLTPQIGITVGDPVNGVYEIWRTTNGGLSWSVVPSGNIPAPLSANEYAIVNLYAKQGSSNIWFGTNQGRMFYSTDAGVNWNVSNVAASTTTITEIAFCTPLNGVAYAINAGNTFELYNTTNGGSSWNQVTPVSPNLGLNDVAGVPGTNYFVSVGAGNTNTIVSYSSDNGVTWTDYGSTGIQYLVVDFADNTTGWTGSFSDNVNPSVGGIWKYSGAAITGTTAPTAAFSLPPSVCLTGPTASVIPTNSSTGSPAITYSWSAIPVGASFSNPTAALPTITFNTANAYTITLAVTNTVGTHVSSQVVVVQNCSLPTVGFTLSSTSLCNNVAVSLTNTSTGGAPAPGYLWSASPASGVNFLPSAVASNPSITVTTPGVYTITLDGTNTQGSVQATQVVTVTSCPPNIAFTVPTTLFYCESKTFSTTNTTSNPSAGLGNITYTWSISPTSSVSISPSLVSQNILATLNNSTIAQYTLTLRAKNASATATLAQTIIVDQCTGINENSNTLAANVFVFPNPAHDQVNVTLPANSTESYSIKVTNLLGSLVYEEKVVKGSKENVVINLANKPKGVYFVTIQSTNEKATKKIIIE